MNIQINIVYLTLIGIFVELSSVALFLHGFLSPKENLPGHSMPDDMKWSVLSNAENVSNRKVTARYDRMIFLLIDALRVDFVLSNVSLSRLQLPYMKYVRHLIDHKKAIALSANAQAPTVTLPRVKALISGTIPGFVDVILNLGSTEFKEDNLIHQLRSDNKTIDFFGDDTWIQLFPKSFNKMDGTTSFFVSDYTDVDNNVTRHLAASLDSASWKDWDVLILHYLGLDHIGHFAGPLSPLVEPKLVEMDSVVELLHSALLKLDKIHNTRTLLVLCGDHGMSDKGSHGGASQSEILTPIVFLGNITAPAGATISSIDQTDLAVSLAFLLGLPIPKNSIGIMINELLFLYSWKDRLAILHANLMQMWNVFQVNNDKNGVWEERIKFAENLHVVWQKEKSASLAEKVMAGYLSVMKEMKNGLKASMTNHDLYSMEISIINLLIMCSVLLYFILDCGMFIVVSWSTTLVFTISFFTAVSLHIVECTSAQQRPSLCSTPLSIYLLLMCLAIAVWSSQVIPAILSRRNVLWELFVLVPSLSPIGCFLCFGFLSHAISLASSSFVEEEHQTWYFLNSSVHIILAVCSLKLYTESTGSFIESSNGKRDKQPDWDFEDHMINFHQLPRKKEGNTSEEKERMECSELLSEVRLACHWGVHFALAVALAFLSRLLRAFNQTGDKYSYLPDISDWLIRPENSVLHAAVFCSTIAAANVIHSFRETSRPLRLLFAAASVSLTLFKVGSSQISLPLVYRPEPGSKGEQFAWIHYSLLLLYVSTCGSFTKFLRSLPFAWFQFSALILRAYNAPVLLGIFVQQLIIGKILCKFNQPSFIITLVFIVGSSASHFFLGNSNSIATVDVSAGYVGLTSYQPAVIGPLLACATYSALISWALALASYATHDATSFASFCKSAAFTTLLCRLLPLTVYCPLVILQRYHIFVWTVFSPKLLYEGMHTLISSITILFLLLISRFQHLIEVA